MHFSCMQPIWDWYSNHRTFPWGPSKRSPRRVSSKSSALLNIIPQTNKDNMTLLNMFIYYQYLLFITLFTEWCSYHFLFLYCTCGSFILLSKTLILYCFLKGCYFTLVDYQLNRFTRIWLKKSDKAIDHYQNKKNETIGCMATDSVIKPGVHYVSTKTYLHIKWEHYEQVHRK